MSILGSIAVAAAKHVAKNAAKDLAVTAGVVAVDKVGHAVLPKDENGVSIIDTPIMDDRYTPAEVAVGAIIHDALHHNNGSDYNSGIPALIEDEDNDHRTSNDEVQTLPDVCMVQENKGKSLKLPKINPLKKKEEKREEENYTIPQYSSRL